MRGALVRLAYTRCFSLDSLPRQHQSDPVRSPCSRCQHRAFRPCRSWLSVPQAEALGVEDGWIRREAGRTCEDAALRARKNQGVAPCRTRSQLGGGWLQDEGSDFFSRRGWGRRGSGGARTAEPLWHGCKAAGRWSAWKGDQQPDSSCCSYDKGCRSTSGQMRRFHCIRSRRCGRGVSDFERVFTRRC